MRWRNVAWFLRLTALAWLAPAGLYLRAADAPGAAARFARQVQPILKEHCYDCHGDGARKGGVAFDELDSSDRLLNHDLWSKVLRNVRAEIMPPEKKPRLAPAEIKKLETWVKYDAFGLDPNDPDPGRVTIRRLNRVEYRNTIRDLMGFDYKVDDEFPPDDTGYGFDNIGDVLSVSPLLLEKYMQAAETIVAAAVPVTSRVMPEQVINGGDFRGSNGVSGERMSFYVRAAVSNAVTVTAPGDYHLVLDLDVAGQFDFDPGRCALRFRADSHELMKQEFGWQNHKQVRFEFDRHWPAGDHVLDFTLEPLTDTAKKVNALDMRITAVCVQGPMDKKHWARTRNHERYFPREEAPPGKGDRREYARTVLQQFTTRAFRRPVDDRTVERLVKIAEASYELPGKSFEDGIKRAMVAVLSSPRFLFRAEEADSATGSTTRAAAPAESAAKPHSLFLDEFSLASRLSYFLWSTMPDDTLTQLAARHGLRTNLAAQVSRMLEDNRSDAFIANFTGQWLQARDVDGIDINARAVLARDRGEERQIGFGRQRLQQLSAKAELTPEEQREREQLIEQRRRRFNRPMIELDGSLRRAMRQETELCFGYVMHHDRSVLELVDSDYTFLNERLAKHYGLTNLDITGPEMRKVTLPADSPRGGVLTEGTFLIVTSNPTRTSPVKRGLFILDNFLGTPSPPPPPDIPPLEDAEKDFKDRQPTLREVLAIHRAKPLCSSCHNRMDPLGLALENFNALGMWRSSERGQPIDSAGKLITGEPFQDIREMKKILVTRRHGDFYRCLTEKMLTYALGRGLEYYDAETVDRIVDRLERENGRFSALLMGIVDSTPFQKRRNISLTTGQSAASDREGQNKPKS